MTDFMGSIIEITHNYATVMTDTCDFVMVKTNKDMFVGQQIKFNKSDLYKSRKKNYIKSLSLVASVLIMIFSYSMFNYFLILNNTYAYIDVDINPSLEFAVDKDSKVLDIKALNKDAKIILKELKLTKLPIKQALVEVVKESNKQGFIKQNQKNSILISAAIDLDKSGKNNMINEKDLDNILNDIKNTTFDVDAKNIKPVVLKVTPEYRDMAMKNEMSMGRYMLYNKIKQENTNITLEEAKIDRVSDMMDKAEIEESDEDESSFEEEDDEDQEKEINNTKDNQKTIIIDENTKKYDDNIDNINNTNDKEIEEDDDGAPLQNNNINSSQEQDSDDVEEIDD